MTADPQYDPTTWPSVVSPIMRLSIPIEPMSKARARFGRNGAVYTPTDTRRYELAVAAMMRAALAGRVPTKAERFGLRCVFYRTTAHRIDCDNLLKAISDAATKAIVWLDDSQCLEVFGRIFPAAGFGAVEIAVYLVGDTSPFVACPTCGKEMRRPPSQAHIKHCSVECMSASTRASVTCRKCGVTFTQPGSTARRSAGFCSRACSTDYHAAKRRADGRDKWICTRCGGPVSRKEYAMCRGCSMKARSDPSSNYWKLRHKKDAGAFDEHLKAHQKLWDERKALAGEPPEEK